MAIVNHDLFIRQYAFLYFLAEYALVFAVHLLCKRVVFPAVAFVEVV